MDETTIRAIVRDEVAKALRRAEVETRTTKSHGRINLSRLPLSMNALVSR